MDNSVTILVSSCDLYEDAWYPFFKLLKIQWPECEQYKIVLNTETKMYNPDFINIKSIASGRKPWSARIKQCLKQIDSDFIMFFLEDQFLQMPVNNEWWKKILDYMKANPDVGVIFPRHSGKQKKDLPDDYILRHDITSTFPIVGMAALYRKKYFMKILRNHESAWEFEHFASIRSKRYREKVLQYNRFRPPVFVYYDEIEKGYGITRKKWLPNNELLFNNFGINVDFNRLGVMSKDECQQILAPTLKQNTGEEKSKKRETLYIIKKRIVRFPSTVRKTVRKVRSLI